jgi:hypothetical protein
MPAFARKRWGQHWLRDPRALEQIAAAAELSGRDTVLEIGPGTGALTQYLLARAGFVVAETQDTPPGLQLAYASSVREPGSYTDPAAAAEARKRLTLPCQLFAGRAAHRVLDLKQSLDWSQPLAAVCEDVAAAMAAFLQVPRDEAEIERADDAASGDADESDAPFPPVLVEEVDEADLAEQDVLAVRLRPPEHVLDPNARLAMALRPPRATA